MTFVGSMFNGAEGAGFQAQQANITDPVTQAQINQSAQNAQSGLSQQQSFVNALQAQNGIGNQSNVYNQLQGVASGAGPNPAQAMLNQSTGQNVANQAALMASQRGAGQNAGLIARQAAQQGAANQQNAIGQGASLQAQQSLNALGQMGGLATQQVGQQQSGLSNYNQAAQNEQQQLLGAQQAYNNAQVGMQSNINSTNSQIAGINTQGQQQLLGGLLNGGSAAAMAAHGGMIRSYANGGDVDPTTTASSQPLSFAGRFMKGYQQNPQNAAGAQQQNQPGMFQTGNAIGSAVGAGIGAGINGLKNLFGPSQSPQTDQNFQQAPSLGSQFEAPAPTLGVAPEASNVGEPSLGVDTQFAQGGRVHDMKQGGKVPGQAQVKGDSYSNDTVPAMLSPREIVIPRSITMGQNAGEMAKQFVEEQLRKNRYAEGGEVEKGNQPTININVPQSQGPQPAPEPVQINPNFMRGQQMASNQQLPQNQFADQVQPKYQYSPQGAPIEQKTGPQNYQLPQAQGDNSITNKLPQVEEVERPVQEQIGGIEAEAKAKGQLGQQQASLANQQIEQQQANQKIAQDQLKDHFQEVNNAEQDVKNGHINPDRFLENQTTIQKVKTAIGLILGGMGGGLTHQENPAMKFLQSQIDRDIHAQQAELGKKENLLSANFRKFGNLQDAQKMTQAMQYGIYATQLERAAAQTQNPVEKARAMQASAQLRGQIMPTLQQIKVRNTLLGQNAGGQNQASSGVDPAVAARFLAPDESSRNKALEEVKQQQNINSLNENALSAFDQVSRLQTVGSRLGSPIQSNKQIDAAWDPMIDKITKVTEGRVVPITVELMSSLKPKVTDSPETVADKRQRLLGILNSERSTPALTSLGINMNKSAGMAKPNSRITPSYQTAKR